MNPWFRLGQIAELLLIFVGLPILITLDLLPFSRFALLLLATIIYLLILVRNKSFDKKRLGWHKFAGWKTLLSRYIAFILISVVIVAFIAPFSLFRLPGGSLHFWMIIMIAYPLFSVLPQTIIYRAYFFHRFKGLLKNDNALVLLNAILFAWLHIIFGNWFAVITTFIAGIFFSLTYLRSKSMLVCATEHALYGNWIFTVGIGSYFWLPTV